MNIIKSKKLELQKWGSFYFIQKEGEIMNIQSKINKLIKALNTKGYIYLVNKEQFLSKK